MPCIINKEASLSKQKGNIWEGFCGKTLWMSDRPFQSPEEALKLGKPICKKCRRLAGLAPKTKVDVEPPKTKVDINKFKNHYCPHCLGAVDPRTGDHWHGCEYESSHGDQVNPQQPLTELEMLERRLKNHEAEYQKSLKRVAECKARIVETKQKISAKTN